MRRILLYLTVLLAISSCAKKVAESKSFNSEWNLQKREKHLNNRKESATWDHDMLQSDGQDNLTEDFGPFELGVFPEPKYDLLGKGSFKGLGNQSGQFKIEAKDVLMNSFFIGENELNKERLKGLKDEVFFQILVLVDTLDHENFNLSKSIVISRNHPDYLGQGFIKTKWNRIDFMAFKTAEHASYAVVNTRIFDLSFGKTILIAPQNDKTLRSLQIQSPRIPSDSLSKYTEDLIKSEKIVRFFLDEGNI